LKKFKVILNNYHINTLTAKSYDKAVATAVYLYGLEVSVEEIL